MTKGMMPAFALAMMISATACGHGKSQAADSAGGNLTLTPQQAAQVDSISALESAKAAAPALAPTTANVAEVHHASSEAERRREAESREGVVAAPAPKSETVVKHTQRDAAIGAAAGAILGVTSSRNKVKGGLIGGAVGGILGGVIGNNVDKKKVP